MQNLKWIGLAIVLSLTSTADAGLLHRERLVVTPVTAEIYRGGKPSPEQLAEMAGLGIRTVINLQGGDLENFLWAPIIRRWEPGEIPENIAKEQELVIDLGMHFLSIPINSLAKFSEEKSLAVDLALEIMGNPDYQPIYLHCEYGRDRTGLLIALYKVKYLGWHPLAAYREWIQMGHSRTARVFTSALDNFYFEKVADIQRQSCADNLISAI